MLNLISNIVLTWFALGITFLLAFLGMEIIAFITRPDYHKNVKLSSSKVPVVDFLTLWFAVWPIAAYGIIKAVINNQTLTEYLTERSERLQAKIKKVVENARKVALESPYMWHLITQPNGQMMLLVRNLSGLETPTHVIWIPRESSKQVVCFHAMPDPSMAIPFHVLANAEGVTEQATKLCLDDIDWAHLCVPGMEIDRKRCWKKERKAIKRMKELVP